MFNSKLLIYQGVSVIQCPMDPYRSHFQFHTSRPSFRRQWPSSSAACHPATPSIIGQKLHFFAQECAGWWYTYPIYPSEKHESVGMIILNKHQPDGGLTWKTWLWRLEDCFMSCCCRNKLWFHVGYSLRTWGCRPKTMPIIIPSVDSFLVILPIQSAILGYPSLSLAKTIWTMWSIRIFVDSFMRPLPHPPPKWWQIALSRSFRARKSNPSLGKSQT